MNSQDAHNRSELTTRFSPGSVYQTLQRLYSGVPYRFARNGYAFPPWHFLFEVSRRCNLRCRMCQYIEWLTESSPETQKQDELTTEEWFRVIDQVGRFRLITFTGGEPWVRPDFLELLTRASRRTRTHFISNATLLEASRAEAVVRLAPRRAGGLGLNFVGVSIEGPAETHDAIRRMPGAFEKAMDGVRLLRSRRAAHGKRCPLIHVTTVIQEGNVAELPRLPKLLKDAGADTWNLASETRMFETPGFGCTDPACFSAEQVPRPRIDRARLQQSLQAAQDAARDAGIEIRMPRMPVEDLLDSYAEGIDLRRFECRTPWNTCIVGRRGEVFPCWSVCVGNVREHSLRELWNNTAMRRFRQTCQQRLFAICPGCCHLESK